MQSVRPRASEVATIRTLITRYLHTHHCTQSRAAEVIARRREEGWVGNHLQAPIDYDRQVVWVRDHHSLWWIFDQMGTASQPAGFHTRLLEPIVPFQWPSREAVDYLGRHGLVVWTGDDDQTVRLSGSHPSLARMVNQARYGDVRRGYDIDNVVIAALGLRRSPQRLRDEALLRADDILRGRYAVEPVGLLDRRPRIHLQPLTSAPIRSIRLAQ